MTTKLDSIFLASPVLAKLVHPDRQSVLVTGEDLMAAARAGDERTLIMIDDITRWMALGIVNISNILDPERVVTTGGLAAAADILLSRVEKWRDRLGSDFSGR